jgi:hypothetical protein
MRSTMLYGCIGLGLVSVGCHAPGAIATTGKTYWLQDTGNFYVEAVTGSAAQDLKCPNEQISVSSVNSTNLEFAAEGCGQRAVYTCGPSDSHSTCQMALVSKSAK